MRKFIKTEKMIIATGSNNYTTYDCKQHGVFQKRNDVDDGNCPYKCNSEVTKIENITELKEKFCKELGLINQ